MTHHLGTSVRRAASVLAICSLLVFGATACGSDDSDSGSSNEPPTIGMMIFDIGLDPFVSVLVESAKQEAKSLGVDLKVANGRGDLATQNSQIDQFVTQGVDAIIVYPGDPEGIIPAVTKAEAKGIPTFTMNLALKEGAPVVSYTGADDREYGRLQGELLVEAIGESGKVGLMQGQLGTSAQLMRTEGIKAVLKEHPGIELVEEQPDNWQNERAVALIQDWMAKYPKGQLDAVVAQGPELVAAAKTAHSKGRDEIKFIAGDYPEDVRQAIIDGILFGTVNQDPRPQGKGAVRAAYNWVTGKKAKVKRPANYLPLPKVTKQNVKESPAAY
jgi:ABC-type sugar transport system substrate-binding protein